jgi:catechol 2,3-dioxygenase-like lactoylglutathione lyase family enzyme
MSTIQETSRAATRFHVALHVRDLARSIEFYSTLFEREPSKVREGYAKFEPQTPPLNFTLNAASDAHTRPGRLSHLGIEVENTHAVAVARERLERAGLATRTEDAVTCCYSVQDKVWTTDPDGNEWEVFTVLRDAAQRDSEASSCCSGECGA